MPETDLTKKLKVALGIGNANSASRDEYDSLVRMTNSRTLVRIKLILEQTYRH
ncbi:MAG: hypothetical protein R3A13_02875 [Bdellovibrionota bacterium]